MAFLDNNAFLNNKQQDILIVGGGLAGMAMACALSSLPLNICIIETHDSVLSDNKEDVKRLSPSFDDRALALSLASIKILSNIGVFTEKDVQSYTPIEQIHVSDRGHIGAMHMSAKEVSKDNMGRVVSAPELGYQLARFIQQETYCANIQMLDKAKVEGVTHQKDGVDVVVTKDPSEQETLSAKLLVLADGGRSDIAEQVGLNKSLTDYQQSAILANVVTDQAHMNCAYERFTDTGPIALLPLSDSSYKLVMTVKPEQLDESLQESDEAFLQQLQERFGRRAGKFTSIGKRQSYPMQAQSRPQIVSGRVALIGNAAHSLHPIAGQGFNLGLRDIASLAQNIGAQFDLKADMGDAGMLMQYQAERKQDIQRTALFTDKLVKIFSTNSLPTAAFRNLALLSIDRMPNLKKDIMYKLMGLGGQQFKLLTGEPLTSINDEKSR